MANPQVEDGNTRIANDLLEAISRLEVPGAETRVLLVVARKTYGWQKKEDNISLSQFSKETNMTRTRIIRAIKNLVRYGVLGSITGDTSTSSKYWIIKDYDKWTVGSIKRDTSIIHDTRPSIIREKNLVSPVIHTKESKQKKERKSHLNSNNEIDKDKKINKKANKNIYDFNPLWLKYPKKLGKHDAHRHFNAQVLTEKDYQDINLALDRFLTSPQAKGDPKYIPHGSTWFNNKWRDWVDYVDPASVVDEETDILKKAGLFNEPAIGNRGKRNYYD